ncbi:hypothetical protein ACFQ6C_26020 [Streptomyces sp. NPDC056454]|uniref:hypothetical protein n=1 Tax=Streptomyces sp. NPDC056454 TaxID=3345823 RepID=UPI003673A30D
MADMNDKAVISDEASVTAGGAGDPFGGGSHRISWSRDVVVGQLQNEISLALGDGVRIAVAVPTDDDGIDYEISAQHRLTIFVTPASAGAGVEEALAAHRPDPYYGMTPEEVERAQLEEKIRSGAELTMRDMQAALRILMP